MLDVDNTMINTCMWEGAGYLRFISCKENLQKLSSILLLENFILEYKDIQSFRWLRCTSLNIWCITSYFIVSHYVVSQISILSYILPGLWNYLSASDFFLKIFWLNLVPKYKVLMQFVCVSVTNGFCSQTFKKLRIGNKN